MIIVYSFIGCFFALIIYDFVKRLFEKQAKNETKELQRTVPKNIGKFRDPMGEYEKYKDETNLYKTYVPTKNVRRGGKDE